MAIGEGVREIYYMFTFAEATDSMKLDPVIANNVKIKETNASIAVANMIKDGAPLLENYAKNAGNAITLLKYAGPYKQRELKISIRKANAMQVCVKIMLFSGTA